MQRPDDDHLVRVILFLAVVMVAVVMVAVR